MARSTVDLRELHARAEQEAHEKRRRRHVEGLERANVRLRGQLRAMDEAALAPPPAAQEAKPSSWWARLRGRT